MANTCRLCISNAPGFCLSGNTTGSTCNALTLERLAEALYRPRLPDRGRHLRYDLSVPASSYVADDLNQLQRISMTEVIHGL